MADRKEVHVLEGIKDYDRVRRFLRNIHLYGFFSREDFKRAGIASTGDYNAMSALIRMVMPEVEEDAIWRERKKYPRVLREYARSGDSRLADSYLLYALDEEQELPAMLRLLACLGTEEMDLWQVAGELAKLDDGEEIRYPTARRRMMELTEYGVLEQQKRKYRLREDRLALLGDRELYQLRNYVCFAAGVTYPRVAAGFLLRSVDRELLRRGVTEKPESAVLLRHSVNNSIFDEEIVYTLLEAIRDRRAVTLTVERSGHRETREVSCLPLGLRVDVRLGRWYLLCAERRPVLRRVRNIRKVKLQEPVEEAVWQEARTAGQEYYVHAGVSTAMPAGEPVTVEAVLRFGENRGMRRQFIREMRLGTLEIRDDGEYYRALVNDPVEVLPLLRSYAPWLRVLPGNHDLDSRLQEGLRRMRDALKEEQNESVE